MQRMQFVKLKSTYTYRNKDLTLIVILIYILLGMYKSIHDPNCLYCYGSQGCKAYPSFTGQDGRLADSNPHPSSCEATELTTTPICLYTPSVMYNICAICNMWSSIMYLFLSLTMIQLMICSKVDVWDIL